MNNKIKPIALYLPQFHPIPENDEWWGKGFTEWTNVTKAKPLFRGHWQPRLPTDFGFYDLRVPEVRQVQAQLAKEYGIYGFCYWHYWFAGKRILERPFEEVVKSGKPDFPFCLAWANQSWKGTWHGLSNNETLIEQTYPGEKDYEEHFYSLLDAFRDPRYIEVEGKKLFFIFRPTELKDSKSFIGCWQKLANREGLKGMHIVAMHMPSDFEAGKFGYDAFLQRWRALDIKKEIINKNIFHRFLSFANNYTKNMPSIISYKKYTNDFLNKTTTEIEYPLISCNWDNTPRSGVDGWLFNEFSMEHFEKVCYKAFELTKNKKESEQIVIIKSWNEWAEGNYMEPDHKFGLAYLKTFKKALDHYNSEK